MLLVDGNAIGFASQSSRKLHANGMQTQAAFGFLKSLRTDILKFRGRRPIILWDGHAWRYESYPEYKSGRDKNADQVKEREAYRLQKPLIMKAVKLLGVSQVIADNMEADDLAGDLIAKLAGAQNITMITGDGDWQQLIRPNVDWYDRRSDKVVNSDNFAEMTGYASSLAFLQGKALQGDTGDFLKGVGGLGEKAAPIVLKEYGSVKNFFMTFDPDNIPESLRKFRKKLVDFHDKTKDGRKKFVFNIGMMNLIKPPKVRPPVEGYRHIRQKLDEDGFIELCEEYSFLSIINNKDVWLKPFRDQAGDK